MNSDNGHSEHDDGQRVSPRSIKPAVVLVIIAVIAIIVAAVVFGPEIIRPKTKQVATETPPPQPPPLPSSSAQPAVPSEPQPHSPSLADIEPPVRPPGFDDLKITGKDYRLAKGYFLLTRTDPITGNRITDHVSIDEMLLNAYKAKQEGDEALRKLIEDRLLKEGDRLVPDLDVIMTWEDDPILLTQAAATLGAIGTDNAMLALLRYIKCRNVTKPDTQEIATAVIDVIGACKRKDSAIILNDIALNGTTSADRAEALRLLGYKAKRE